ncbi:GNAT family N-acyltransferase [Hydrogenimonas sp.]
MFKCIEAKDEELIKEIYRFRCEIACDELNILKREDYPEGYEMDEYDKYSIQYAVLNDKGEVVGCMRLVHHSPIGYPASNTLRVYDNEKGKILPDNKTGELSRIFIRSDCRGIKKSRKIVESIKPLAGKKLIELGLVYTYGALEENFFKFLLMLKMPYRRIGPYMNYSGRIRALYIMDTEEFYKLNKEFLLEKSYI